MIFLWDNLIDKATLVPSTELETKPIVNLKDSNLSRIFAFGGNSGSIVIDLLTPILITDLMIAGTNITDNYTTLRLEGNTTDSWTSPAYSIDLEKYSNSFVGEKGINQTYRYWRIIVADSSVADIYMGWCYIGNRLQLPGIDPGITLNYNTNTAATFSISQQLYSNIGDEYFSSSFKFPIITDFPLENGIATREDILEFWFSNRGATPIVMIIWDNDRARFAPMVGVIAQNTLSFKMDRTQGYYSLSFSFVETH